MKPSVFENFKNENLSPSMIALKRIGQVSVAIAGAAIVITQLHGGSIENELLDTIVTYAGGIGFIVFLVSFAIVGMAALGKRGGNSTLQAIGRTLLKIFLFMFLPAIVITLVLVLFMDFS